MAGGQEMVGFSQGSMAASTGPARLGGDLAPVADARRPVVGKGRCVPSGQEPLFGAVTVGRPAGRVDAQDVLDLGLAALGLDGGGIDLVTDLERGDPGQSVDRLTRGRRTGPRCRRPDPR